MLTIHPSPLAREAAAIAADLRAEAAARADAGIIAALQALILVTLARLIDRLEHLVHLWATGQLPALARPAPAHPASPGAPTPSAAHPRTPRARQARAHRHPIAVRAPQHAPQDRPAAPFRRPPSHAAQDWAANPAGTTSIAAPHPVHALALSRHVPWPASKNADSRQHRRTT